MESLDNTPNDLDINPMTLKLEGDPDIIKVYLYSENKVARLRHSKLLIMDEIRMVSEKYEITLKDKKGQMPPTCSHF